MLVTEHKRHLDGRTEQFECSAVHLTKDQAILKYTWHRTTPYNDGPAYLPAGEICTEAFYWRDRDYLIYQLRSPEGTLYGYRIDICEDVVIEQSSIHWQDLILDFWIDPDNSIHVLDEEELSDCVKNKSLSPEQIKKITAAQKDIMKNYKAIIANLPRRES